MAVSKRLRYEILLRDNHTCRYCGGTPPDVKLTVDHVMPKALGGGDEPSNLVAACADCNAGKSSSTATAAQVEDVSSDALRWAKAMAMSADLRSKDRELRQSSHDAFLKIWNGWTYNDGSTVDIPPGWEATVDRFIASGLVMDDLRELISVAMGARCNDEWAYFCGCCWRRVQSAQEVARQLLNGGVD